MVEHRAHRNLKQGKGIEESPANNAEGFCIETQILYKLGRDHCIGNTVEHGKDQEGGKDRNY